MLTCEALSKFYPSSSGEVKSLDSIDLEVEKGEFLVVRGHSGSGKTTLLLTLGAMLHPTQGKVRIDGTDLYQLGRTERAQFRARNIGFVFQMFHLIPYLNVMDNVTAAMVGHSDNQSNQGTKLLLKELGLGDRLQHFPHQLSAGEKQRAALARAMAPEPTIILADEPTGNLDPENSQEVCRHLKAFQSRGGTVVVVTHGDAATPFADRTIALEKGKLLPDPSNSNEDSPS